MKDLNTKQRKKSKKIPPDLRNVQTDISGAYESLSVTGKTFNMQLTVGQLDKLIKNAEKAIDEMQRMFELIRKDFLDKPAIDKVI